MLGITRKDSSKSLALDMPQAPYSRDGGKTLASSFTMHGDLAWFDSLTGVDTSLPLLNAGAPVALPPTHPFINQKPNDVLALWLANNTVGCAASTL